MGRSGGCTRVLREQSFMNTQRVQDAVSRNFEVIGEASHNIEKLYPEFAAAHPELPLAICVPDAQRAAGKRCC